MAIYTSREDQHLAFLKAAGWDKAISTPLPQDASSRRYIRLRRKNTDAEPASALLMDAPQEKEERTARADIVDDGPALDGPAMEGGIIGGCGEDAYPIAARIAGSDLYAFSAIARALRVAGIHAPEIYAIDAQAGFALIEDLGDNVFAKIMDKTGDLVNKKDVEARNTPYYESALDMLVHLQCHITNSSAIEGYPIRPYDETPLLAEALLLPQWYCRLNGLAPLETNAIEAYKSACCEMFATLGPASTLVLRDFHAENILFCAGQRGLDRLGVIDFQDALIGQAAYDVVSLLEDARREVPAQLQTELLAYYKAEKRRRDPAFDEDQFVTDYAILAAQRNAKILGIFARLVIRDGKEKYRTFLPRVRRYFRQDLARPEAAPMKGWVARHLPILLEPEPC